MSAVMDDDGQPVTLVVVYDKSKDSVVRLQVSPEVAQAAVDFRIQYTGSAWGGRWHFQRIDVNGRMFSVDVGSAAAAVYVES